MNNEIKWGCIQPLTGGMYIGARNAIGKPAEWIISYPGLTYIKKTKTGEIGAVGNEYNILTWCKNHNELPPYRVFNKKPFDGNMSTDIELLETEWNNAPISFEGIDIVVSVPVCSGLSQATIASEETKKERNCNMLWNAKYAMEVIKPKVYIFENAPALYAGNAAEPVRQQINDLATEYNYSVVYYKTDTKFHDNCQRRPRTFVLLFKNDEHHATAPIMNFEHIRTSILDYFSRIPDNATQQITCTMAPENVMMLDYIKYYYGKNYRGDAQQWTIGNVIDNNLWDDFYKFIDSYNIAEEIKTKMKKLCDHIQYKLSIGKNFYVLVPAWVNPTDETVPACMFKACPTLMHHTEDRLYTIREWLHLMGMPHDFEMYGSVDANYAKIGQNVPARTAQWIVAEAARIVSGKCEYTDTNIAFFDNTKAKC